MRTTMLAAAVACLTLTACGSTVQLHGQALTADGLGTSGAASAGPVPGGTAPVAGSVPGTAAASGPAAAVVPGAATATGSATTPQAGSGAGSAAAGPGRAVALPADGKPVEVGIVIYPDVKQFAALFGASGSPGDQKAEAQAGVSWVNAHGGLAGHKVVPVFFEVSLTSTQPYSQTYQQICSTFTEDHKVVAAVFIGNAEPGLPSCLAKKGVLFLAQGHYLRDEADYRALANVVTPDDASSSRVARAMVEQVLAKGLVKRGDQLGLMLMDYPAPQRAGALMTSLLKDQGVSVYSSTIAYPQSTQDISNSAAAVQSAELQMAARGIKAVAFLCPGCTGFFLTDAESQSYYPTYVVSSYDTVGGVKGQGHGRSLQNALAVGWDPMRDVGTHTVPSELAGNATHQLCKGIEKAYAVDDSSEFASQAFCGAMQDLLAAVRANPAQPVTGASLLAGFGRLGTSYAATANFSTQLTATRHDGVAAYKVMRYSAPCDCFQYESPTLHAFA
jgi:hypothetical protein